ncbi:MAG: glycosyltransferase family 4 protein [Acholeplasma sp.]|nr:glycosyltransferase family 4 protein [Acholeplasma sp.]
MKKALMMSSVASMIDLFNRDNLEILKNLGYDIDVACNFVSGSITSQEKVESFKQELIEKNIGVYHIPVPRSIFKLKDIVISYILVKNLCKENNYEIVHCHSPIGGVIVRLACRKSRKNGTKIIYTAHGFHFYKGAPKKNWIIYYTIEKIISKFTDCIITINKEDYQNAQRFNAKIIEYVPGIGVDVQQIRNVQVNAIEKKKELGIDTDDFVLLSVGQLSIRKNHKVAIMALSKIHNIKLKLIICGLGELKPYLTNLIDELKLSDRVILTGYRNDIYELLHIADCFIFPSLQEGLPVSLMEAMSVGLPIICSDIRGNIDLIHDGENGFLHDPKDDVALSNSIMKILDSDDLRLKMGEQNRLKIESFDRKYIKEQMTVIYENIVK